MVDLYELIEEANSLGWLVRLEQRADYAWEAIIIRPTGETFNRYELHRYGGVTPSHALSHALDSPHAASILVYSTTYEPASEPAASLAALLGQTEPAPKAHITRR